MQNVELKAGFSSLENAIEIAIELGALFQWTKKQIDIYYTVSRGRLKIRLQEGDPAELIGYARPDISSEKISDYEIYSVTDPDSLQSVLGRTLPVLATVEKNRTLYLWKNTRIHLDDVVGLGCFLEFESVCSAQISEKECRDNVEFLKKKFSIQSNDLIAVGYLDLILNNK